MTHSHLSKRVHWRRIKNIYKLLGSIENIDLSKYNFSKITCYSCYGDTFQGKNVKYYTNKGFAAFVDDNKYDIFEASANSNFKPAYGKSLLLAYNSSFDYWVLTDLSVYIDKASVEKTDCIYETARIKPYGMYTLSSEDDPKSIRKTATGENVGNGGINNRGILFDRLSIRKNAYKTTDKKIVSKYTKVSTERAINKKINIKRYKKK